MARQSWLLHLVTVSGAVIAGLCGASAMAWANPPIIVSCNATGQTCDQTARFEFNARSPHQNYAIAVQAPATQCSEIKYFTVDRLGRRVETQFLSPGQTGYLVIGTGWSGLNSVRIGGEARTGGCNVGQIHSFGVIPESELYVVTFERR